MGVSTRSGGRGHPRDPSAVGLPPDREPIQPFGVGDCEHVAGQGIRGVGGGFVWLVACAVAADVDIDEAVIAPELLDVPGLGPSGTIAAPAMQQHERPTLARHLIADPYALIRDLRHPQPPAGAYPRDAPPFREQQPSRLLRFSSAWPQPQFPEPLSRRRPWR